jgi:hypothetical protein
MRHLNGHCRSAQNGKGSGIVFSWYNQNNFNMKKDNDTLAHLEPTEKGKTESNFSYNPEKLIPKENIKNQPTDLHNEVKKEALLEKQEPHKGYSTDPKQSKTEASLHLADEDMDKPNEDPVKEAKNLKES